MTRAIIEGSYAKLLRVKCKARELFPKSKITQPEHGVIEVETNGDLGCILSGLGDLLEELELNAMEMK